MAERTQLDCIEGMVKDIHKAIYVGDPGSPPVMTRLALLEQEEKRRKVWIGAALSAATASICATIWAMLTSK